MTIILILNKRAYHCGQIPLWYQNQALESIHWVKLKRSQFAFMGFNIDCCLFIPKYAPANYLLNNLRFERAHSIQ